MMRFVIIVLLSASFVSGCKKISKSNLLGSWQAVSLTEDEKNIEMNFDGVTFTFNNDGGYQYNGTLNHHESGFFDIKGSRLLTLDTLNNGSSEKAVEILELNNGKLRIKMKDGTNDRILEFKRNL